MAEVFIDDNKTAVQKMRTPFDPAMNVFQRMHAVMNEIGYISKDRLIDGEYYAVTAEAVVSALRPALAKYGLLIFPVEHKHHREDERAGGITNRLTTLDVVYRIQNIDSPKDYIEVVSTGTAVDLQDKGSGKAMTYAYKYMALQTFAIETGMDPDHVGSDRYSQELAEKAKSGKYLAVKKKPDVVFEPVGGEPIEV